VFAVARYAPHESLFHQGQKHANLNFIKDIFREGIYSYAGDASAGTYSFFMEKGRNRLEHYFERFRGFFS
jgi:hypothetical protein